MKDFFPEFKENAPLRFSELFPVKESLKPSIWKRLRKRKARQEREQSGETEAGSAEKKRKRGWVKDYAPIENFVLAECDSVRYESVMHHIQKRFDSFKLGSTNQLGKAGRWVKVSRKSRSPP